jgi:hypothetical protein
LRSIPRRWMASLLVPEQADLIDFALLMNSVGTPVANNVLFRCKASTHDV